MNDFDPSFGGFPKPEEIQSTPQSEIPTNSRTNPSHGTPPFAPTTSSQPTETPTQYPSYAQYPSQVGSNPPQNTVLPAYDPPHTQLSQGYINNNYPPQYPAAQPATPPTTWTPAPASHPAPVTTPYQWTPTTSTEHPSHASSSPGDGKPPKKKKWRIPVIILAILLVVGIPSALFMFYPSFNSVENASSVAATSSGFTVAPISTEQLTAEAVFEKASPAVVGIQTYSNMNHLTKSMLGEGSGIIFSSDGYIITNSHVVTDDEQKAVLVLLADGNSYQAKIVGKDPSTDLAVLKIDATNLSAAEFGDSDQLKIGQTCYAIGNPGGADFANSMTNGIVSGLNRQLMEENGFIVPSIQTNAAINPGNSGGALVNSAGQVIGITSSKIALEYFEGMGFAIPISDAQPVINELIQSGSIKNRPRIGITYSEAEIIDDATAKLYGIPSGILVSSVDASSDAAAQGLKAGDIIHMIDGKTITGIKDVSAALRNHSAGDEITVEIYRPESSASLTTGETLTITFKLMEQEDS